MQANKFLIGLALAHLGLTVSAGTVSAMPLQSRLEVPQSSGSSPEARTIPSGPAVKPGSALSASDEKIAETRPLSPLATGYPLPARSSPNLPSVIRMPTPNPAGEYFRGVPGETAPALSGRTPAAQNRDRLPSEARHRQDTPRVQQQTTLKELVRVLINRPGNLDFSATVATPVRGAGPAPRQGRQGDSILGRILTIAIDKEMVETISKVLRPSIGVNGVVALNVFGLRDIALLVAPGSNNIRVIDLGSGRSMSFKVEGPAGMSANQDSRNLAQPGMAHSTSDSGNLLPEIIATFRRWVSTYVFNGFTLTVLGLISIFWFVWGLANRER